MGPNIDLRGRATCDPRATVDERYFRRHRYLPRGRWNNDIAAQTYRGPIFAALGRYRGERDTCRVLEDNDPSGYKPRKAIQATRDIGISTLDSPKYSPYLNPMGHFVWEEIGRRMQANALGGRETRTQFTLRLQRIAFNVPEAVIRRGGASMKRRAQAVFDAKGAKIPRD